MKLFHKLLTALVIATFTASVASAAPVPAKKKHQTPQGMYLTSVEAHDLIKKDPSKVLFIDVRTPYELEYVGYTDMIDKNIPIAFKTDKKWNEKKSRFARVMNKEFVAQVEAAVKAKGLTKEDTIVFICRSGSRSVYTTKLMAKAGYNKVATVVDGFEGGKDKTTHHRTVNGWKNANLPWTYKLDKTKMYMN